MGDHHDDGKLKWRLQWMNGKVDFMHSRMAEWETSYVERGYSISAKVVPRSTMSDAEHARLRRKPKLETRRDQ